jgi:hypothetical protein
MISIRKEQEHQVCGNDVGRLKRIRTPSKAERYVSFYPHVVVRPVLVHLDDYTNAEIEACWFGQQENSRIFKGIRQTVNLIERNILLLDNDNQYCSRGLEALTSKGRIQTKQIRANARDAVLHQQDLLRWQAGSMVDGQKIADIYRGNTQESRIAAYIKGVSDAATIRTMNDAAVPEMSVRTKIMERSLGQDMPRERSHPDDLSSSMNHIFSRAA